MSREDKRPMLPGEHVASIEEFEGGKNTYLASDVTVRSASVGTRVYDLKRRIVKIEQKNSPMLPKVGDIIVGYVEMLFSSMVSTKVLYITASGPNQDLQPLLLQESKVARTLTGGEIGAPPFITATS